MFYPFLQNLKLSSQKADGLEGDLTQTKHKLLEMKAQLEMTEKARNDPLPQNNKVLLNCYQGAIS